MRVREQVRHLLDMIVEYVRNPSDKSTRNFKTIKPVPYVTAKIQRDRIEEEKRIEPHLWTAYKKHRPFTTT